MKILDHGTMPSLLRRIETLQPDTHAHWGKMNAHQMLCHLNDSKALALGRRPVSEKNTFSGRVFMRWIALYTPLTWPRGVATRPEADQFLGGTRPVEFERDRAALIAVIEELCQRTDGFEEVRHPIFGRLTEWEWRRWAYLHTDHHLRQFGV
jgi:Protein of unknown function (DUF1569)